MTVVPASTRIRRSRAHNVDTDRLFRRRAFLTTMIVFNGARSCATRMDFAVRAAEMMAIEDVLIARHMLPANMRVANIHRNFRR